MDRRRKDHAIAPLKSKSGEQNASHQWASVRKESISYPLVGGGEERQIYVGEVV